MYVPCSKLGLGMHVCHWGKDIRLCSGAAATLQLTASITGRTVWPMLSASFGPALHGSALLVC